MKTTIKLIMMMMIATNIFSQNVTFSDLNLKAFLVNEYCVDTDNNSLPDIDADLNNDGEIQISEANSILNLHIAKLNNDYNIQSLQDLSAFTNLEFLKILYNNGITNISNLGLSNLKTFWFGSQSNIDQIDISDLTEIIDLRIEDCDVNSLNIKNGSVAPNFSLFYSENIQYACVDDITEEYNETLEHMAEGILPTTDCSLSTNEYVIEKEIKIFPNPTNGQINFNTKYEIGKVTIFNSIGQVVFKKIPNNNSINISYLIDGVYFLRSKTENGFIFSTIIKN